MSDMKCPFCQQELDCMGKYTDGSSKWMCNKCDLFGDKKLFDEIIRTRKTLEQSEICCTEWEKQALDYKAENIALSGDLDRTRKALDVLLFTINRLEKQNYKDCAWHLRLAIAKIEATGIANNALKKITELEQKENKI